MIHKDEKLKLYKIPNLIFYKNGIYNLKGEKSQLNSNQIICGTGSDEILIFSSLAFCAPGYEVIHALHGF